MKKLTKIALPVFLITFITAAVLFLTSCGSETTAPPSNNADSCGVSISAFDNYSADNYQSYNVSNGRAYMNYWRQVDSICTDNHLNGFFHANWDTNSADIRAYSAIEWSIFFQRVDSGTVTTSNGVHQWDARILDLGIKAQFGEGPGSVFVNIYVHFQTRGSEALDKAYILSKMNGQMSSTFDYKKHKINNDSQGLINSKNWKDAAFVFETEENSAEGLLDDFKRRENKTFVLQNPNLF